MIENPRDLLRDLLQAALAAANPLECVPRFLPEPPRGRTVVVGAGKASAAMAQAVEAHWPGPLSGLVVTRYGYGAPCRQIEIVEAAHPVPDAAGRAAAGRILDLARSLQPDDLLLCLISGGGSALLSMPAGDVTLEDKQAVTRALLRSGAAIDEINTVRKHLSAIKGGRLAAAAAPARVVSLIVSDVPGDDPATVASGPTVADPTTVGDAWRVLERHAIDVPESVRRHLESEGAETPKPGDRRLAHSEAHLVARPADMLTAAAARARDLGVEPIDWGDALEGEARDVAAEHADRIRTALAEEPGRPLVMLSGGELTVTVRGDGHGGPNTEYALALARSLDGCRGVHAIAVDTDGIDGSEDNAGAVIGPDTMERARAAGLDPDTLLDLNESYRFFAILGDLVMTGPTRTNVNDFRAIVVDPG